ncbi:MAG: hypothetical protein K2K82_02885 [Muribaculaceae bacterium]|nr:hypothetical protein [Muribaculaceae bacterium]
MNITTEQFQYMKEGVATDLVEYLIKDLNVSLSEALNILYNSELFSKLSNPATGLYYQGSRYVYTFLQHELRCGVIG